MTVAKRSRTVHVSRLSRALSYAARVPGLFDHVLFFVLAALGPLWGATYGYRRLARTAPDDRSRIRLTVYRATIAIQWGLSAVLVGGWLVTGRPWATLGLAPRMTGGLLGVALGTMLVAVFIARQRREVLSDDAALAEVRERMSHLEPVLPRSAREMREFAALAVTAGICEELLYRGFMIQYLAHFTSLIAAAAIASVIFGIGHAYQRWRGVQLTTLVGGFLSAVYLISGSLVMPMLLHALMDLHSGHLAYVALQRQTQLDAERASSAWVASAPHVEPAEAPPSAESEITPPPERSSEPLSDPGMEPPA